MCWTRAGVAIAWLTAASITNASSTPIGGGSFFILIEPPISLVLFAIQRSNDQGNKNGCNKPPAKMMFEGMSCSDSHHCLLFRTGAFSWDALEQVRLTVEPLGEYC